MYVNLRCYTVADNLVLLGRNDDFFVVYRYCDVALSLDVVLNFIIYGLF